MSHVRNNVIPISYVRRQDALKKELVYRYNKETQTCDLFIVSPEDQTMLIDITANIRDKIDNLDGDTIMVYIEGIGEVSIAEIIEHMTQVVNSAVRAIEFEEDLSYVSSVNTLDDLSLGVNQNDHSIEIKGYKKADDNSIPVKRNGTLVWIPMISSDPSDSGSSTIPGGSTDNSGSDSGDGTIIQPGNPTDGIGLKCFIVSPSDHRLYLMASRRQKTLFITGNNKIILPTPFDEKSDIEWMIMTNDEVPTLTYPSNVFWKELPTELSKNTIHTFIFKTWDGGRSWTAEMSKYSSNANNEYITKEYLEKYYYNKDEVDNLLSWDDALDD